MHGTPYTRFNPPFSDHSPTQSQSPSHQQTEQEKRALYNPTQPITISRTEQGKAPRCEWQSPPRAEHSSPYPTAAHKHSYHFSTPPSAYQPRSFTPLQRLL
ncbi:hypothetical protein PGT21_027220 [Puccinia graminis f. sp. tritici]|uniref:Uncharacterized protein n=1 Tax=Puccinia graminis f. sp. tritici TaxID=56615 RepID=A0A5B0QC92_PUCGR|nr:hypothetical protein PGT21_027220 [Puccinia graminis f. sp. tritici]